MYEKIHSKYIYNFSHLVKLILRIPNHVYLSSNPMYFLR